MPPLEGVSLRYGFYDDEECNKIRECVAIKMSLFSFRVENLNRGNTRDRDSSFGCYVKSESREIRDVTTMQAGGLVFFTGELCRAVFSRRSFALPEKYFV